MEKLLSIEDLFLKSFEIYKKQFWTVVKLTVLGFVVTLPLIVCAIVVAVLFEYGKFFMALWVLLFTLIIALGSIISGVLLKTSLLLALTNPEAQLTVKQHLMNSSKVAVSYVYIHILATFITILGFMLFIVPGIIFCMWFSLASYVLVKEQVTGWPALQRSKELVKGYWWPIFGRTLVMLLLIWFVSYVPLFGVVVDALFLGPLFTVYVYLIYEDLRRIKSRSGNASI